MIRQAATTLVLLLLSAVPVWAEQYPLHRDLFVNDYADVLPDADESRLRDELAALKRETGIEATVLTIGSRQDYDPSPNLETFATGLFNNWGIGDATRNDGLLVLVVAADREMRIELGSGYNQGYDVLAQDMVNRFFLPDFRNGDMARGIVAGTDETVARIARRHAENLPPEALPPATANRFSGAWIPVALFVAFGAFMLLRRRIGDALYRLRRCPNCGRTGLRRVREVVAPPATDEAATGVEHVTCRHCTYRNDRPYRIVSSGSSGSGSFGGGHSSGGGASGRW